MTPERIKAIRAALGLTQQQLADAIGGTQITVSRWETGVSHPTGAYLKALEELEQKSRTIKTKKKKEGNHGRKI